MLVDSPAAERANSPSLAFALLVILYYVLFLIVYYSAISKFLDSKVKGGGMMNRRTFLFHAPPLLATLNSAFRPLASFFTPESFLTYAIDTSKLIGTVPKNVMGLSYESTQLGDATYFDPSNRGLVHLFRTLSANGVLRLGGNTSDFTYFKSHPSQAAPAYLPKPTQPKELTPITPRALHNLRAFLDATGWTCIYGLNLGTAAPDAVAEEAAFVIHALGAKLEYLQIGNEANNYVRKNIRPSTWDPKAYVDEWLIFARAVIKRNPRVKLGGPDMGAVRPWMKQFADQAMPAVGDHIVAITDHFYAEGPPTSPESTMHNLLFNTKILHEIEVTKEAGAIAKRPYRMTEVNSCYSGGKPGVSDTLGSALWAGDLTLDLVAQGFCGVNFHGGGGKEIRASLGGALDGDHVASSEAADSYYTPIAGTRASGYLVRPIYYGMLLAAQMAGSDLVQGSFSSAQPSLAAYSSINADSHSLQSAFFNKGSEPVEFAVRSPHQLKTATVVRLHGTSIEATSGVTFGPEVSPNANWRLPAEEQLRPTSDGSFVLSMPPTTAAFVSFR